MLRKVAIACIALFILIPFVPHTIAGGWAAVVLNEPLDEVVAGAQTTIEFQVLHHGRPEAPLPGMETDFLFLNETTGYFVAVSGEATADPEVYAITFALEQAGEWELRAMIRNFNNTPMLTKLPGPIVANVADPAEGSP